MALDIGLIGFGEAGLTFARAGHWGSRARAFDIKTTVPATREGMLARYASVGVMPSPTLPDAIRDVPLVLSLVTADQAFAAAKAAAGAIGIGALFLDMNSVAPHTKCAAACAIEAAGGQYVDVAVMAPVDRGATDTPLLVSGGTAPAAAAALSSLGFTKVRIVGDAVGQASSVKMIRSVLIKGLEALTAECLFAASAAGVCEEVLTSLDSGETPRPWAERANYNLDRMMVHGERRAAEMEEVVRTLDALGSGAVMSRSTVELQRAIGRLGLLAPEQELASKIEQIAQTGTYKP
jgi:3-hydroxyisobutyrate dehydrogenase-like beta-hydroxyacid dehydrogenase